VEVRIVETQTFTRNDRQTFLNYMGVIFDQEIQFSGVFDGITMRLSVHPDTAVAPEPPAPPIQQVA
jgi:hypothetical protein